MLYKEEVDYLINNGYVFNSKTDKEIYENYFLLLSSLSNNYQKTMKSLNNYSFEELNLIEMDQNTSKSIYQLLIDNNFILSENNCNLIEYNPLFLIASLKNDYSKTINLLNDKNNLHVFETPFFMRENKILEDLLMDNSFVLTSRNVSLIKNNPSFLLASLKNYPNKTLILLKKVLIDYLDVDENQIRDLVEICFRGEEVCFGELPIILKNTIIKYIGENWIKEREFIRFLVNNKDIPITYISSNVWIREYHLWDLYKDNKEAWKYVSYKSAGYSSECFNDKDEKTILNLLGESYKDCKQIEGVFPIMKKKNLSRDNMSVFEMLAIQLYAAKELKKNNVNVVVDVFAIDSKMKDLGNYNGTKIELFINSNNNDVVEMVNTIVHEVEHVIQYKNIEEGRIDKDSDIDIYSKDKILRELLGDNYYYTNYGNISFEFDAAFKSYIKTAQLFNLIDEENDADLYERMQKKYHKVIDYAYFKLEETGYYQDALRLSGDALNSLFENEMRKLRKNNFGKYEYIISRYPIIKYEYNVKDCFERKSIEEIIEIIDSSDNKQDIGIYFNIIKTRLDLVKEYYHIEESVEEIKRLYSYNKYNNHTQKILENLVKISEEYVNKKYRGYFYKSAVNKR